VGSQNLSRERTPRERGIQADRGPGERRTSGDRLVQRVSEGENRVVPEGAEKRYHFTRGSPTV